MNRSGFVCNLCMRHPNHILQRSFTLFSVKRNQQPLSFVTLATPLLHGTKSPISNSSDTPWYLRENNTSKQDSSPEIDLPIISDSYPSALRNFVWLLGHEFGLDSVLFFDLTTLNHDHPFSYKNHSTQYILIASGKSEKHIFKAAFNLRTHVKHTYKVIPSVEGMVSSLLSPLQRRRMLKRARKGPMATDSDYGRAGNSWVMFNTGVYGIHIHILMPDRRQELQLDSMYSPDYVPQSEFVDSGTSYENRDTVFAGIRRNFCTSTSFGCHDVELGKDHTTIVCGIQTDAYVPVTTTHINFFKSTLEQVKRVDISFEEILAAKSSIEAVTPTTIAEYSTKYEIFEIMHLKFPILVSVDDLEHVIFEKYSSWQLALDLSSHLASETKEDIVRYIKALIDSPQVNALWGTISIGEFADKLLNRVSHFVSRLTLFSPSDFNMYDHPDFVVLLWRLVILPKDKCVLSIILVNNVLSCGSFPRHSFSEMLIAVNRARDLSLLLGTYADSTGRELSEDHKESILFLYGNSNVWVEFWRLWDEFFGVRSGPLDGKQHSPLLKWTRLVVYLALRNDKGATTTFLKKYWHRSQSAGIAFLYDFESCDGFENVEHAKVFVEAVMRLLRLVEGVTDPKYAHVNRVLDKIKHIYDF